MKELVKELPKYHSLLIQYFTDIIYFEIKRGSESRYSGFEKEEDAIVLKVKEKIKQYKNE